MEVWRDIPGYDGIYQASSEGRIRSAEGKKTYSVLHGERVWKSRILKPKSDTRANTTGYRITLWKDKKPKDYLVARLICTTFFENNIDTDMTVNHKDGNRLNNNTSNLEWTSLADNIRHGFKTGLYSTQKGITLSHDGATFIFRSLAQASRYLGRSSGYMSYRIKVQTTAFDKRGKKYEIV